MAFLRIQRKNQSRYYMILRGERRGDKVVQKLCEYLGRDPDPKQLKRALDYWGVKATTKGKTKGR